MKYVLLSVLSILTSIAVSGQSGMMQPISFEWKIENAQIIIEGRVVNQRSFWNEAHDMIYTSNEIVKTATFKGTCGDTIQVLTMGGIVGNEFVDVSENINLNLNQSGVFMLKPSQELMANSNSFELLAGPQGLFLYSDNKVINPFQGFRTQADFYNAIIAQTSVPHEIHQPLSMENKRYRETKSDISLNPLVISGGTKSVVTIGGSDFGSDMGSVAFKKADDGGMSYVTVLPSEIVSWTDTEIQVEVPSSAGSGTIEVTPTSGVTQISDDEINITFSQTNALNEDSMILTSLIDQDANGGYTWHMFTGFDSNDAAREAFLRAFNSWVCETDVHWTIGEPTDTDNTAIDGENVIRFATGTDLPEGVLGRCISYGFICGSPQVQTVIELDMIISNSVDWHIGIDNPQPEQYDFESVVVHELGHGHQLNHVIEPNDIMYYGLSNGVSRRDLSVNDAAGANFVHDRCSNNSYCSFEAITSIDCEPLSLSESHLNHQIKYYPNPVSNSLFIETDARATVSVFNTLGQSIDADESIELQYRKINTADWKSGLYFVEVWSEEGIKTTLKVIKN